MGEIGNPSPTLKHQHRGLEGQCPVVNTPGQLHNAGQHTNAEGHRALGLELKWTELQKREKGEQRTDKINKNQITR